MTLPFSVICIVSLRLPWTRVPLTMTYRSQSITMSSMERGTIRPGPRGRCMQSIVPTRPHSRATASRGRSRLPLPCGSHDRGAMRQRSGFSLIELAVVMAIVIIMTGLAVPAFGRMVETSRMQAAAYQLAGDLKLMRENAILYQADLTMYLCTDPADQRTFYCFELLPRLDSTTGLPKTTLHYLSLIHI